jgi:hypothetical protein
MNKGQQKQLNKIESLLEKQNKYTKASQRLAYENGYLKALLSTLANEYNVVEREIKNRLND